MISELQVVGWGKGLALLSPYDSHQEISLNVQMFNSMSATDVYVPRVNFSHPPDSLGDFLRLAGKSGPGSYQFIAFALGPRTYKTSVCTL